MNGKKGGMLDNSTETRSFRSLRLRTFEGHLPARPPSRRNIRTDRLFGSEEVLAMARCDQCGNDYDKTFNITFADETYTFDSFECAIQKLAPSCPHCGCRIIGHGVEQDDIIYCCAHCAEEEGAGALKDRA
jgi:hypothetical protein